MTTTTTETIPCPACKAVPLTPTCERCEGKGTVEHIRIIVHDRMESKAMIDEWINTETKE